MGSNLNDSKPRAERRVRTGRVTSHLPAFAQVAAWELELIGPFASRILRSILDEQEPEAVMTTAGMNLRQGLGGYRVRKGARPFAEGQLTLHDTGELIRRAGLHGTLHPISEFKVRSPVGALGKIDWVWFEGEEWDVPKVAFEIEGCGVSAKKYRASLDRDVEKLDRSDAALKLIVLFQVDHDCSPKPGSGAAEKLAVAKYIAREDIHVLLDTDLWTAVEGLVDGKLP